MKNSKNAEYHLRSIELAHTVEKLGGKKAVDSYLMNKAVNELISMGWTKDKIVNELQNLRRI